MHLTYRRPPINWRSEIMKALAIGLCAIAALIGGCLLVEWLLGIP